MQLRIRIPTTQPLALVLILMTAGCDDEATQIAREASNRQAEQNRQMATLQRDVSRGTRELVESDAEARKQIIGVHRDLQHERKQLGSSWNDLEAERQRIDRDRRSDSAWQALITVVLGALVLAAFFGFLRQLLVAAQRDESVEAELTLLLVDQFLPVPSRNSQRLQDRFLGETSPSTSLPRTSNPEPPHVKGEHQ